MIVDESKKLMPLVKAVEAATGHRPHLSTVIRWCVKGISGVKLKNSWVGGRRLATPQNVQEFMDAVSQAKAVSTIEGQPQAATVVRREKEVQKAAEQLASIVAKKPGRKKANC